MQDLSGWASFVAHVAQTTNTVEISKRTRINQSTIYRWLYQPGAEPRPAHAARFAQTYGVEVLRAFVAAGWISREEAGVTLEEERPAEHYTTPELEKSIRRLVSELASRSDPRLMDGRPTPGEQAEVHLWWQNNEGAMHDTSVVDAAARDEDRD